MIEWSKISLEELAAYLCTELQNRGVETVLVGGACVTIYSKNRYQSYDLDFATYEDQKKVKRIMLELGFTQEGKYYTKESCPWIVEFVSPPIAVGNEPIFEFSEKELPLGTIKMLRVEDSVKDRLASFFHWNDRQGLLQAVEICKANKVNLKEIESWAKKEGHIDTFKQFTDLIHK